jgi:hypothetical protein
LRSSSQADKVSETGQARIFVNKKKKEGMINEKEEEIIVNCLHCLISII